MTNLVYPIEFISEMLAFESEIKNTSPELLEGGSLFKYIAIKKLFSDICDCLDFINFSIIVCTEGKRILSVESFLSADLINRFAVILTNSRDEFFVKTIYAHRFHSRTYCEDNADYLQLLERKFDSLEKSGIISFENESCVISYSQTLNAISEIQDIMKRLGVDRDDIIDSTSKIALLQRKNKNTIMLYKNEASSLRNSFS